jgi:hypothetical protein
MLKLKFATALLIFAIILSCSRITEKVEQKVDEKINRTIEEKMKEVDSTFSKEKLDSLKKHLDSLANENPQKNKKGKKIN